MAWVVPAWQRGDGDAGRIIFTSSLLTQALNGDGTGFAHVVPQHHVVETLDSADRETLLVQYSQHLLTGQHLGRHSLHLHVVLLRHSSIS